jgi:hypothetical protein
MMSGMPVVEEKCVCDTCIITKQCLASILMKAKYRPVVPHYLFHDDLCETIMSATPGDQRLTYMSISLITTRSDATSAIKKIKAMLSLRSDDLCGCYAWTTMVSSWSRSLTPTVSIKVHNITSLPLIRHSEMEWCSVRIRLCSPRLKRY